MSSGGDKWHAKCYVCQGAGRPFLLGTFGSRHEACAAAVEQHRCTRVRAEKEAASASPMPRDFAKVAGAKLLTIELVQKRPFLSSDDEWGNYCRTYCSDGNLMRPWQAKLSQKHLGMFTTSAEAALHA